MHATMQLPEKGGSKLLPQGVRPHQGVAAPLVGPLAMAFAWSVHLWALILLVVTDGSSSVFWWAFPFIFDLCLFCIRFPEVRFLVSFAPFYVSYLKLIFATKLVERLVQSPTIYLFYLLK